MKLDVNVLRYLTKDEFRVLTATEMGMKNHELVPAELVDRIAGLKHGGAYKNMKTLLKNKLVHHDSTKYDGYRLTNLGYDFLAIKTMVNRGLISGVGRQIGVGKESDIFEVMGEDGRIMALKLHRLGRTSFRAVKSKRDYLKHRSSFNWLYLSRLAALKEYAFMKIDDEEKLTMIDFPQMVSVSHRNAEMYFDRDVECIYKFFGKRYNYAPALLATEPSVDREQEDDDDGGRPNFEFVKGHEGALDNELAASGFTKQNQEELERFVQNTRANTNTDEDGDEDSEEEADSSETDEAANALMPTESLDRLAITSDAELSHSDSATPATETQSVDPGVEEGEQLENSEDEEGDPTFKNAELQRGLEKQRKRVVKAVKSQGRQAGTRNASKDKGGRRSRNVTSKAGMDF